MIKPTLFVGLGTTGLRILKSLRQLMFEEYGREGLPIFRYVSIETDGAVDGTDGNLADGIQVVKATIPTTAPISNKLDPNQPLSIYNEYLEKWLDPRLLNYVESFMKGASNIRMAGRLCLWENWAAVRGALDAAHNAIIAPDTTTKTVATLSKLYATKGLPVPDGGIIDDTNVNTYIVGSLCGGSCSGMLIDVAYFCGHLLGVGVTKNVYGIFTMFDEQQAAGKDAAIAVPSANCFASLWELNYYNHLDTIYDITFPSGQKVRTAKTPFDYVSFVSRSNMTGGIFAKGGKFDEDGLNLMVALNLFADTAGDTDGQKAAILTDGVGFPGIGGLKEVPKGEIPIMVRSMASFGLTAVWYPKYRIASAASCLIGRSLCERWLDAHVDLAVIVTNASKEWVSIFDGNIGVLAAPKGQLPIKDRIENHLNKAEATFNKATSANHLKHLMETFPSDKDGPYRNQFAQGGEYFDLMNMQVPVCKKAFLSAIEQVLNIQLAKIDVGGTYGLGDVRAFFVELDKEIARKIEEIPTNLPSFDLNQLGFDLMDGAENNRWTKLIFLQDQSVKAQQKELITHYRRMIIGSGRNSIYQSLRNHFLRPVLQEVRKCLGFGVPVMDAGTLTIRQKLDRIEANLKSCVSKFDDEYNEAIDQSAATAVKIVTNNPQNRVDKDAETISAKIEKMNTLPALLKGKTMAAFLDQEDKSIITQMTETYQRLSLDEIPVKNVVEQVRNILGAGGSEEIEIKNLAKRSDVYQNFIGGYESFNFVPPLRIISGHDPTEDRAVLTSLQEHFVEPTGIQTFERIGISAVDHLLFFYKAESGFALDDLASYRMLKNQFETKPGKFGHYTHQNPDFYDLTRYHKTQKLQRWCQVLVRLVPEICNRIDENAFDGVFRLDYGRYVFDYRIDSQLESLGLNNHQDGIKMLSSIKNTDAYNEFIEAVQSKFMILGREKIIENIINPMLLEVENLNTRTKLSRYFNQFLDEVYSDNVFTDTADDDDDFESYFSNVNFPTHENTQSQEAPSTSAEPNQNVPNEPAENTTADSSDDYGDINVEETEVEVRTFNQTGSTSGTEDYSDNTDANKFAESSDDATDEVVWAEAETETEHSPTEEEPSPKQQPHPEVVPETDTQQKQQKPAKPFSVADVDPKILRRDSPRKKE